MAMYQNKKKRKKRKQKKPPKINPKKPTKKPQQTYNYKMPKTHTTKILPGTGRESYPLLVVKMVSSMLLAFDDNQSLQKFQAWSMNYDHSQASFPRRQFKFAHLIQRVNVFILLQLWAVLCHLSSYMFNLFLEIYLM